MDTAVFGDFTSAARAVLSDLRGRAGFDMWLVTGIDGSDCHALTTEGDGYGLQPGRICAWSDTICARMVLGEGPPIAPRVADVPAYSRAPLTARMGVGAYAGVPLRRADGTLSGTLCAVSRAPVDASVQEQLPLMSLQASLLSAIQDATPTTDRRLTDRLVPTRGQRDPATGVYDLAGWCQLLRDARGHDETLRHTWVVSVRLPRARTGGPAGASGPDDHTRRVEWALLAGTEERDYVARVGVDELAVLAVERGHGDGGALEERLAAALSHAQVRASVGIAAYTPGGDLAETWARAQGCRGGARAPGLRGLRC